MTTDWDDPESGETGDEPGAVYGFLCSIGVIGLSALVGIVLAAVLKWAFKTLNG